MRSLIESPDTRVGFAVDYGTLKNSPNKNKKYTRKRSSVVLAHLRNVNHSLALTPTRNREWSQCWNRTRSRPHPIVAKIERKGYKAEEIFWGRKQRAGRAEIRLLPRELVSFYCRGC